MSRTFSSLSIRNYRHFFIGNNATFLGMWMTRTAQAWLVLAELTDGDATALGWLTSAMFLPTILFTPLAGSLADRFPKRVMMLSAQSLLLFDIIVLSILTLSGQVQLWHVFVLALLDGVAGAFDNPSRQATVTELVPASEVSNAIGLNATSFNTARLVGPGAAGLLIAAIGTGPVFVVNAVMIVFQIAALLSLDKKAMGTPPVRSEKAGFMAAVRYIAVRPPLLLMFLIALAMGAFGFNQSVTNPLMSTQVFGKGATEFGILGSVMGIGSLTAALVAARRPRPRIRQVVIGLGMFAVSSCIAAVSPSFLFFLLIQIPLGMATVQVMVTANALVQTSVAPDVRGRIMAVWGAVIMGLAPFISPLVGWIGSAFGARATVWFGAIGISAAFLVAAAYLYKRGGVDFHMSRTRPWLDIQPHQEPDAA
ncbi:MAG: MFS transporter [Propionibacteriaceae bacterium]